MMTDYTKLLEALRCKVGITEEETKCEKCPYGTGYSDCDVERYCADAADVIESLMDAEKTYLAELAQCHENLRRAAETRRERDERIEALQAQLPKRGEWIWDDKRCIYVCSVCGSPKVRENMDRQIIKEQAYCYSCGAKIED